MIQHDSADTSRDLPVEYGYTGQDAGRPIDALDDLEPGDRVLWGDRTQACTVARVVTPDDRIGQALTASVISASDEWLDEQGSELSNGDVFLDPDAWGTLRGKRFAVIQGPRGGFYALAEPEQNRSYPALFRAVRSYHQTSAGQPGQGAWRYEEDFDYTLEVVEAGEPPAELDPEGDLPAYEEIKDNPVVSYDQDTQEHYTVAESVEALFDEGIHTAHNRARAEHGSDDGDEDSAWDAEVPEPDRVAGTPRGHSHSTVTVTEVFPGEYRARAALDAPAPWNTPDGETPINDVIKSTPWDETHYDFDSESELWLVDARELVRVASVLRDHGYSVRCEY